MVINFSKLRYHPKIHKGMKKLLLTSIFYENCWEKQNGFDKMEFAGRKCWTPNIIGDLIEVISLLIRILEMNIINYLKMKVNMFMHSSVIMLQFFNININLIYAKVKVQ